MGKQYIKESAIKRLRPKSGFIDFYENLKKYSAVNAEITITVGNSKNDCLDNETVSETIEEIMENKDIIKRAEIGVKYDNEPVETLDLFSNMVHDFITFKLNKKESLSSEYTASEMSETFNNRKGILMDILRKG